MNRKLEAIGRWWRARVTPSLKAIGRWSLALRDELAEGLKAWWQAGRLYRENFIRRRRAAELDRERQAVCLDIGTREETQSSPVAAPERQGVAQARAACRAAEERREVCRANLAEAARQTAAAQGRCEQALAGEHERCRRAMERVRENRKDDGARAEAEDAIRRIKKLRWAWQADYGRARAEGLRLGRALEEADRGVSDREADLAGARRRLGLAVFLAGGAEETWGRRLRILETEWTRLQTEMTDAVGTLRALARTGRRTAVILAVALVLLIGGAVSYRAWHRAHLQQKLEKITRDVGRQDRDKTKTEKAADQELDTGELRIVE